MDFYQLLLGIPPAEQPPNHYRLLGLCLFEPNPEVIQVASDGQMAHLNAFHIGPYADYAQRLASEVAAARACLLRHDLRAIYDHQLMQILSRLQVQPQPFPATVAMTFQSEPVPMAEPTPTAASDTEEDESDIGWDSSASLSPSRRTRRARRKSEGNFAALGLVAVLIVAIGGALIWRSSSRQPDKAHLPPQLGESHQDISQHAVRKQPSRSTSNPRSRSATRKPDADMEASELDSPTPGDSPMAGDQSPAAPTEGKSPGPSRSSQVPSAFAGRLDPRMNPDLESILGSDNTGGAAMTGQQAADMQGWDDDKSYNPKLAAFDPVSLGSKFVLSMSVVDLAVNSVALTMPADAEVFVRKNSERAVTGAFTSVHGVLNGPAVELNAANRLALFGGYENGQRDGAFRLFGQQRKRLFYSQYARGAKRGVTCVFKNGQPCYVEVTDQRGVRDEFLIHFIGRKSKVTAKRDFSPDDLSERNVARERLALLETTLAKHEQLYEKQVEVWWEGAKKKRKSLPATGNKSGPTNHGQTHDVAFFTALLRGATSP